MRVATTRGLPPAAPHPHAPKGFINGFFIVARYLNVRRPLLVRQAQWRWRSTEHVKDAAQGAAEDVPQDVAQDLAFGAWAASALLSTPPTPPPPSLCSSR